MKLYTRIIILYEVENSMNNRKRKMQIEGNNCLLFVFFVVAMPLSIGIVCEGQTTQNSGASESAIELQRGTEIVFAGAEEAKQRLTMKDDFINSLSPFERSARLKTDQNVSETEFLEHVANQVRSWTIDEKNRIRVIIESVSNQLKPFELKLPQKILLIKTTGQEEGGAAYSRPNAIVIPQNMLIQQNADLQKLLIHELFHIFTANNPKLKEALYGVINFKKCDDIELPVTLREIKITNPDGIKNDHYIEVQYENSVIQVVPIIYSSVPKYNVTKGGEFFRYLRINLLVIEKEGNIWRYKRDNTGEPVLLELRDVPDYFNKIGFNTNYTLHPEEILADNFVLIVQRIQPVKSKWVIEGMQKVLQHDPGKIPEKNNTNNI
jgi:hypothetical protein